ncbi:MAG: hypothetical protein Q7J78_03325, partial [Clostridiales bacterium]|nr:hypothetical protein [Clostridiales bacterium]
MDHNQEIRIKNTSELTSALERVMLVSTQSNSPMEFLVKDGILTLKAENTLGRVYETVAAEIGKPSEMSFLYNPRYLLDAAKAVRDGAVIFISAKGMLHITAEGFDFLTAPVAKPKTAVAPKKAAV